MSFLTNQIINTKVAILHNSILVSKALGKEY